MHFLKPDPGTYALILESRSNESIQIGRWREMVLTPGYYIYVGSAFGPGGLKARLSRHLRKSKPLHWHIDYLREIVTPIEIWYSHDPEHLEHRWASVLSDAGGMNSVKGFGCTDCKCASHLFWTSKAPEFMRFLNIMGGNMVSEFLSTV